MSTRRAAGRYRLAALLAVALLPQFSLAETVRDNFDDREFDNNDGTVDWSAPWIEIDDVEIGPRRGNVIVRNQGQLDLDNRNGGTSGPDGPSAAREVDLSNAVSATLTFDWETTRRVDDDDSVTLEISSNGGSSWTTLEVFDGIVGNDNGSESYNILPYAASNTQVRFRVDNEYEGGGENFRVEFVEIDFTIAATGTDLSVTQTDSPDPVNVASPLAYSLMVANAGPDDATGVTVTNTLPSGTTFISATATQGSCSQASGVVICTIGSLSNGSSAVINIAVLAPTVTGTITNSATVAGDQSDSNAGNDTSAENTFVQNLNVNRLCYLVADSGGSGGGGSDLFTRIDTSDFNPATNETSIGSGTGTTSIEAIAFNSSTGVVYAANANRLGTLSTTSGVFQALPQFFGTGSGSAGNVSFSDIDGLTYDATTGVLYGSHARGGDDLLIQIDMTTGAHVPNAFGAGVDYVTISGPATEDIVDDIAVDPATGTMYAVANGGGNTDQLITINKTTGATQLVDEITVPDIEGLGTDSTGQLWGTSGSQGILYEINKFTGVGSNGRSINNGSDYEAVDCFAISPSVSADLSVAKLVDESAPSENDSISYVVTVSNAGPSPATVVQLTDSLPDGVTFVSATQSQGTYDAISGDWFVGDLSALGNATLTINATVDASTGGTTITNTAAVAFLSQEDPDPNNNTASVAITPLGAALLSISKTVSTFADPRSGTNGPFAIPGATMLYTIEVTNSGTGPVDPGTLIVTDEVPEGMALRVLDFDTATDGPVAFDSSGAPNALMYTFAALDDPDDDVEFTENDGADNFEYQPEPNGFGVDPNVTHIRIRPTGSLLGNTGSGDPRALLQLLMILDFEQSD